MSRQIRAFFWVWLWLITSPAIALSPSEVFKLVSPSVVIVKSKDAQGSGVVIDVNDEASWIATNCHVVLGREPIEISIGAISAEAWLIGIYEQADVCLLGSRYRNLKPVEKRLARPKIGDRVYSIGAPRGLELTLAEGLVSQIREDGKRDAVLIQTTAAISPGSSGGGLFDDAGKLVGLTTFKIRQSENLNFAVSSYSVHWAVEATWQSLIIALASTFDSDLNLPSVLANYQFLFLRNQSGKRYVELVSDVTTKHKQTVVAMFDKRAEKASIARLWDDLYPIFLDATDNARKAGTAQLDDHAASRWTAVFENKAFTQYIDQASVLREGALTFVTSLTDFKDQNAWEAFGRSSVNRFAVDCAAQASALISVTSYDGPIATGSIKRQVALTRDRWKFDPATDPKAPNAAMLKSVCR